ncbi:MAG TPA: hypothetical protein VMU62_03290 [Acidobacteriaceae bacterium]|nr:hypothetical protein [Acidobacteriaceae bacterium]
MKTQRSFRHVIFAAAAVVLVFVSSSQSHTQQANPQQADPWKSTQMVQPGALAALLAGKHDRSKPVVIQIGFDVLYRSKHISDAIYAGPASTQEGLHRLEAAVSHLPRSQAIDIYCGCCPMDRCPNIRPAFRLLEKMGFTDVKVLMLPTSFGKDWVASGYPIAGDTAGSASATEK